MTISSGSLALKHLMNCIGEILVDESQQNLSQPLRQSVFPIRVQKAELFVQPLYLSPEFLSDFLSLFDFGPLLWNGQFISKGSFSGFFFSAFFGIMRY
ncbi:hypothetical protein DHL47_11225 [Streptococcus panodentis]|uniref:Uncharacterized protein n=1 Tax=Streptococcus panodentis TaxID=1581472 RepID=A0ABS5AZM2_9STRE|nr:hypothetical protein [Streptococcus panodentis]